jgi:hypothetical protein
MPRDFRSRTSRYALCGLHMLIEIKAIRVGTQPGWTDDLVKVAGVRWMRVAQDRPLCHSLGEVYVQQWTYFGRYGDTHST